jgi:thiol-disulfide isomerase/thioredoxin
MKRVKETLKKTRDRIKGTRFGAKLSTALAFVGIAALLFYFLSRAGSSGRGGAGGPRPLAADFSMPDVNGTTRALSSYRGQIVLLDFWATWCEPCLEELPDLIRFQEAHKAQGFTIVGVAMDAEGVGVVGPFVRQNKIPYPILISNGDLPAGYSIIGFPAAFLIDKNGAIVRRYLGSKSYEELERDVAELSAAP